MAAGWLSQQRHAWTDPATGTCLNFCVKLILPTGTTEDSVIGMELPVAVYWYSMGEKADAIMSMGRDFIRIAPEPFVLVCPARQKNMWWFIDNESEYGWALGKFRREIVQVYCRWLESLASLPGVDSGRIGFFGWSAGAYAVTELLAEGCIPVSGVGLGAVHGHGQRDIDGLPPHVAQGAVPKFESYLERLMTVVGVPWIEATHGNTDQESKFSDAQEIFRVLTDQQETSGLPPVSVRELEPDDQDVRPKKKKNRTHHNYFNASFLRGEFFTALFGGPAPSPDEMKRKQPKVDEEEEDEEPTKAANVAKWSALRNGLVRPATATTAATALKTPMTHWGMMMSSMAAGLDSWDGGAGDDVDMECWDMKNKGRCPRGASCKYCQADAMNGNSWLSMMAAGMEAAWLQNGQAEEEDMACWDMAKKGYCPRGEKCKYCKADKLAATIADEP